MTMRHEYFGGMTYDANPRNNTSTDGAAATARRDESGSVCAGDARQRQTRCASPCAQAESQVGNDARRARTCGEGGHESDEGAMSDPLLEILSRIEAHLVAKDELDSAGHRIVYDVATGWSKNISQRYCDPAKLDAQGHRKQF